MAKQDDAKLTPEELAARITKANFWKRVHHFVKHNLGAPGELPVIQPGTADWNAWQEYFERHLQWVPVVMREVLDERGEGMTVPTPRPEQFDLSFVEQPDYRHRLVWWKVHRRVLEEKRQACAADHTQQALLRAQAKPFRTNNVFIAPDHSLYPQMVEKYDRGEGGKVGELRGKIGLCVPLAWMPQKTGGHRFKPASAAVAPSLHASPVLAARIAEQNAARAAIPPRRDS